MTDRELMKQVMENICGAKLCEINSMSSRQEMLRLLDEAITALRDRLAQPEQEPVAWSEREIELIDGMIEVQLKHARTCDSIANRTMADKQKGWDLERVTLLEKIKASTPPQRQWVGPTMKDAVAAGDGVLMEEQAALLRECRAALDSLISQKPTMAGLVCGSTTLGNLRASMYNYRPQGIFGDKS